MSIFTEVREIGGRLQNFNFEVFKEPRGIMRILQLVFAVFNILALRTYSGYLDVEYGKCSTIQPNHVILPIEYPFNLQSVSATTVPCINSTSVVVSLEGDFSSEASFLHFTCWVSAVLVIIIAFIYVKYREAYESNGNLAMADFVLSVVLAVLWISSLGAWGYGQSQLKKLTLPDYFKANSHYCNSRFDTYIDCLKIVRGSVTGLTISMILSFLNFFLWAAGLWFLYKETSWYLQFQRA